VVVRDYWFLKSKHRVACAGITTATEKVEDYGSFVVSLLGSKNGQIQ